MLKSNLNLIEINDKAYLRFYKTEEKDLVFVEWEGAHGDRPIAPVTYRDYLGYREGERSGYDIVVKAQTGRWPAKSDEKYQTELSFLLGNLQLVHDVSLPNNPDLFSKFPELEEPYNNWLSCKNN